MGADRSSAKDVRLRKNYNLVLQNLPVATTSIKAEKNIIYN